MACSWWRWNRQWLRFCTEVLEQPALAGDARFSGTEARVANRPALDKEIGVVFGKFSREQVIERLRGAQIAYGAVNSVADLERHPQLRRVTAGLPGGGAADLVAPPARLSDGQPVLGPVPALDEQGAAIRAEFAP
ncbi:MAG: CoA transferase [Kiloniellales bacterium]